jgi:hypothetical protein
MVGTPRCGVRAFIDNMARQARTPQRGIPTFLETAAP